MKDLAVFDLDGTMIPGDSFADLVRTKVLRHPRLMVLAAARRLGAIDRLQFAASAHKTLMRSLANTEFVDQFAQGLAKTVDHERLAQLRAFRDNGTFTLLLSASPNEYVAPLGASLGFDAAVGSHFTPTGYRHLWGARKRLYLDEHFPTHDFQRLYAIGDSDSDDSLLAAFEKADKCAPLRRRPGSVRL